MYILETLRLNRIVWGLFIISILAGLVIMSNAPLACNLHLAQSWENSAGRQIIDANIPYQTIWSKSIAIPIGDDSFIIYKHKLFISMFNCNQVFSVDLRNNKVFWKINVIKPDGMALDMSDNVLYVEGGIQGSSISAIDIWAGEKIWTTKEFSRTSFDPKIMGDGIVMGYKNGELFNINPETGKIIDRRTFYFHQNTIIYNKLIWCLCYQGITAEDLHNTIFSISDDRLPECCLEQVIVDGNLAFIATNRNRQLFAIDMEQKIIVWQRSLEQAIGNLVISDGRLYLLEVNAKLNLLDMRTGESLGYIQFAPPEDIHGRDHFFDDMIGGSWMAAEGNLLAIYFQDTDTLMTLQIGE